MQGVRQRLHGGEERGVGFKALLVRRGRAARGDLIAVALRVAQPDIAVLDFLPELHVHDHVGIQGAENQPPAAAGKALALKGGNGVFLDFRRVSDAEGKRLGHAAFAPIGKIAVGILLRILAGYGGKLLPQDQHAGAFVQEIGRVRGAADGVDAVIRSAGRRRHAYPNRPAPRGKLLEGVFLTVDIYAVAAAKIQPVQEDIGRLGAVFVYDTCAVAVAQRLADGQGEQVVFTALLIKVLLHQALRGGQGLNAGVGIQHARGGQGDGRAHQRQHGGCGDAHNAQG